MFQVSRDRERWFIASVRHFTMYSILLERLVSWNSDSFTAAHVRDHSTHRNVTGFAVTMVVTYSETDSVKFNAASAYRTSSVNLADWRECSFCNYRLLQGFILYRNLFDFLLRLVVLKRLGFQSQKYGIPICTSIIKFYAVCFWIRDNHRYSKTSYISTRTKSMLYCGLSHVQL